MATFKVRIFGYRGIQQMPLILSRQFSADSVFQLVQPYEFSEAIEITAGAGSVSVSSLGNSAAQVQILRIEVPDGYAIRYEINPSGRNVAAGDTSPMLSGINQFYFQPNWKVSAVDVAAYP